LKEVPEISFSGRAENCRESFSLNRKHIGNTRLRDNDKTWRLISILAVCYVQMSKTPDQKILDMNTTKSAPHGESPQISIDLENIRNLSNQIMHLALSGLLRIDFLRSLMRKAGSNSSPDRQSKYTTF